MEQKPHLNVLILVTCLSAEFDVQIDSPLSFEDGKMFRHSTKTLSPSSELGLFLPERSYTHFTVFSVLPNLS